MVDQTFDPTIVPGTAQDFWSQFTPVDTVGSGVAPVTGSATMPGGSVTTGSAGAVPSYVNLNDPVQAAVWQAFQAKGITPRDQGDFNYWVDHINQSGGLDTGYAKAGGTGTWAQRMAAASGGVGDYGGGSGGGMGGGFGGGVTPGAGYLGQIYGGQYHIPTAEEAANTPGYQFALSEGLKGVERGAAAKGTLLTGGTLKGLAGYASGLASQNYMNLANLGLNAFNTNYNVFRNNQNDLFNRYYNLSDLGYRAASGQ